MTINWILDAFILGTINLNLIDGRRRNTTHTTTYMCIQNVLHILAT